MSECFLYCQALILLSLDFVKQWYLAILIAFVSNHFCAITLGLIQTDIF